MVAPSLADMVACRATFDAIKNAAVIRRLKFKK